MKKRSYKYKMNITQENFFGILSKHTLDCSAYSYVTEKNGGECDFYGTAISKTAKIRALPFARRQLFNPIADITTDENENKLNVTVKLSLDIMSKLFIIPFILFFGIFAYFILYQKYLETGVINPVVFFVPLLVPALLIFAFGMVWRINKRDFFERFETLYKDFIIQ